MTISEIPIEPPKLAELLTLANQLRVEAEADGSARDHARSSLFWVVRYLDGQGLGQDIIGSLWHLISELTDLDEGKVGPITKPSRRRNVSEMDARARAIALAMIEHMTGARCMHLSNALDALKSKGGPDWTEVDVVNWRKQREDFRLDYANGAIPKIGFSFEEYDDAVAILASDPEKLGELLEKLSLTGFRHQKRTSHGPRSRLGRSSPVKKNNNNSIM